MCLTQISFYVLWKNTIVSLAEASYKLTVLIGYFIRNLLCCAVLFLASREVQLHHDDPMVH